MKKALEKLDSFEGLEEGWDGYGGLPISPAAIKVAKMLLEGFFICPISDGTIGITFGNDTVTILVDKTGDIWALLN